MAASTPATRHRRELAIREAYLNTNLSMLAGWQIAAACADRNCLPGNPIGVGELLTKYGDRALKSVTKQLRCRICQAAPERVWLRQPSLGGLYIEYVIIAPIPQDRND